MILRKIASSYPVVLFWGVCCAVAHANDAPRPECLSDLLSDRAISTTQGWGVLGLDTMVRSTVLPRLCPDRAAM